MAQIEKDSFLLSFSLHAAVMMMIRRYHLQRMMRRRANGHILAYTHKKRGKFKSVCFFCVITVSSVLFLFLVHKKETFLLRRRWWHNNKELRRFLINKIRRSSLLGWRLHLISRGCCCVGGCPRAACGLVTSYCHWMRRDNELGRTLLSRNNT